MALTVKVGTNLPELNKEIKTLSTNARLSSQQLKTLDTNLKFKNLKEIDNLKGKQNLLKNAISDTTKQVTLLNNKYDELAKQKGIDPNRLSRVQVEIERAKQNLVLLNSELKRTNQEIAKVSGKKFLDLEDKIGSLGKKMFIGLSLPIAGIIAALAKLTTSTIQQGDEIAKTAEKLGISAESLQKFQYIAERSGTSFDTLKRSFSIINKISSDMSKGINNSATNAFKKLGISVTDANGKLKSSDTIFLELQKKLAGISDQGAKNNIIFELFGTRMGTELQNVLGLTDEEMKKLMDSAEGLGIMSNDSAKKSEELADKLTDMKQKVNALKIEIVSGLLPIFENVVNFISSKFIPAISKIASLFNNLSDNTKQWIFNILGIITAIGPALLIFAKLSGIFGTLINVFNLARVAVTAFGISFNIATAGIGILIGVLAALLLKKWRI